MHVQLWSYNYDPEPTGIGPVSKVFAKGLSELGHQVDVVAAHPHYPEPRWGRSLRPYREIREGIPVLRLPLWVGRDTTAARYRQELSFAAAQTAAIAAAGRPDVRVVVSPSFPALAPAILAAKVQHVPWVLWIQDILPDGAAAAQLLTDGSAVIRLSRRLERAAYAGATRIAVVSTAFTENLRLKGVSEDKIDLIYNPASRIPASATAPPDGPPRLLVMGNIGRSQGLAEVVRAFEAESDRNPEAVLTVTGSGVEADAVRAEIRSSRVRMLGVVDDAELERELHSATVAVVTQRPMTAEFNIPSKLMNYMVYGLPVLAIVDPASEVAKIVREADAGWVVDSADPSRVNDLVERLASTPGEVASKARRSLAAGQERFGQAGFAAQWDSILRSAK